MNYSITFNMASFNENNIESVDSVSGVCKSQAQLPRTMSVETEDGLEFNFEIKDHLDQFDMIEESCGFPNLEDYACPNEEGLSYDWSMFNRKFDLFNALPAESVLDGISDKVDAMTNEEKLKYVGVMQFDEDYMKYPCTTHLPCYDLVNEKGGPDFTVNDIQWDVRYYDRGSIFTSVQNEFGDWEDVEMNSLEGNPNQRFIPNPTLDGFKVRVPNRVLKSYRKTTSTWPLDSCAETNTVDSLDRSEVFAAPGLEDYDNIARCSPVKTTNDDKKFEQEHYCSAVLFLRIPKDIVRDATHLRKLYPSLCKGRFDLITLKEAFRTVNEVLYELCWFAKVEVVSNKVSNKYLYHFFQNGRQLTHLRASKVTENYRKSDALMHWMNNYETFLRIFCDLKENQFTKRMKAYKKSISKNNRFDYLSTCRKVEGNEAFIRKNSKYTKIVAKSKLVRDHLDAARDREVLVYEGQMFKSVKDHVSFKVGEFAADTVWNAVGEFMKKIPEQMTSVLDKIVSSGSDLVSSVCDFCVDIFGQFKSLVTKTLAAVDSSTLLAGFSLCCSVFMFTFLLYYIKSMFRSMRQVYALCVVKVLNMVGCNLSKIESKTIEQIFVVDHYEGQSLSAFAPLIGLAIGTSLSIVDKNSMQAANAALNFAGRLPSICTSFEDMCKEGLDFVYHWYTGKHWIKDKKVLDQFEEFIVQFDALLDIKNLDEMLISDLDTCHKFEQLYKTTRILQPLLRDMKVNPSLINVLNKAFATVLTKHNDLIELSDYYMTRIETVCLWLYGLPGQGKTTVLEFIVAAVYDHCREKFPGLFKAPYSRGVMHHRNKTSDYWEGYKKQFACIWNEALEKADSTERAKMLSEFLTACEDGVFPLDMAFDQKGKAFFNSYLAIVTSNLTDEELEGKCGLSAPAAVVRRRTLHLQVVRDQDFTPESPNFNEAWKFILRYPDVESFREAFKLGTPKSLLDALSFHGEKQGIILRFTDVVKILFEEICVRSAKRQDTTELIRKTDFVEYCKISQPYVAAGDFPKPAPSSHVPPVPEKLRKEISDRYKRNSLQMKSELRKAKSLNASVSQEVLDARAKIVAMEVERQSAKEFVESCEKRDVPDLTVSCSGYEGHMWSTIKYFTSGFPSVEDVEEVINDGEPFVKVPEVMYFPLDLPNSEGTKIVLDNSEFYMKKLEEIRDLLPATSYFGCHGPTINAMMFKFYSLAFSVDPKKRKRIIRLAKYLYIIINNQFVWGDCLGSNLDMPSCMSDYHKNLRKFCFSKLKKIGFNKDLVNRFVIKMNDFPNGRYEFFSFYKVEAFGFFVSVIFKDDTIRHMTFPEKHETWRHTLQSFPKTMIDISINPDFSPQQITTKLFKSEKMKDNSVHWSLKFKVLKSRWDDWCDSVYTPFMRNHSWLVFGALASVLTAAVGSVCAYYGVSSWTTKDSHIPNSHEPFKCGSEIHAKLPLRNGEAQSLTRGHSQRMGPRQVSGHSVSRGHKTRMHPRDVHGHSLHRGHSQRMHPRIVSGQCVEFDVRAAPGNAGDANGFQAPLDRVYAMLDKIGYSTQRATRYFNCYGEELLMKPDGFEFTGGFVYWDDFDPSDFDRLLPFEEVEAVVWFWGGHQVIIIDESVGSYGIILFKGMNCGKQVCKRDLVCYADLWATYEEKIGDSWIHLKTGLPDSFLSSLERGEDPSVYEGQISSSDQQVTNLAQHIRTIEVKYTHGSYRAQGILSGRRFICVGHFFDEYGLDFHSVSLKNGETDMVVAFNSHVSVSPLSGRRDLVAVDFPRTLSAFPTITKKLYADLDDMKRKMPLDGDFCRLERVITPDDCVLVIKTRRSHVTKGVRPITEISIGGVSKIHDHELYYVMAGGMGVPGDCGLPYAVNNSTGVVMCIGVHTGKTGDNSVFSPLFKSDFPESDVLNKEGHCAYIPEYMKINTPEKSQPVENHKYIYMGQAPKVKIIPKKTRLRASPAQGDFNTPPLYPITTAPAVLDWEYRSEGNEKWIVYPLKNALKKLGASPARPVYSWMNEYCYEHPEIAFEGFFPSNMDYKNIRPWTIEEVLFGIPGVWDGLSRDTAVGYDIECVIPTAKSRKDLWDPETKFIHPLLRILVEKLNDAVRRGEVPKNVVAACLKDETRDLERVELGKTRLFCVGSLSHLVWSVMWMGGLVTEMKRCRLDSDVAIGTNVHAFDWKMIYAKILQMVKDFDLACGDKGNYDSSQHAMFGEWLGEACAPKYRFPKGSFEDRCIRAVCISAIAPLLVVIDKVYWMDYDNASGNWLTGFLNSFVNVLTFNLILRHVQWTNRENDPEFASMARALIFILIVYGDDDIWGIRKKFSKYFNMRIYAKWLFDLFGMTYTTASKGEIVSDFIDVKDISFLCRRFVPTGKFGGNVKAPLDEDSIVSMIMWIREPSKTAEVQVTFEEQFLINIETAAQEWFHYGPERFEVETNKMKDFCRTHGYEYPGHEYSVYQSRWLDHQKH